MCNGHTGLIRYLVKWLSTDVWYREHR